MRLKVSARVTKNDFARIGADGRRKASQLVRKTGFDIVATEKQLSRVDEGTMRNGWGFEMDGEFSGTNYNPVAHTIHNEFGTVHMPAQPMMHPAFDRARDPFNRGLRELFR